MSKRDGESLQDLIDRTPDLVEHFYNDTRAQHFMRAGARKIGQFTAVEFTNWRDEQSSWSETASLFNQSFHMPELFLEGPDALRLLERLGANSLANFTEDRAKQLVACTPAGKMIGDCIIYRHGEQRFELISGMATLNWVHFNAESGEYDAKVTRDDPANLTPTGHRTVYRFQVEGPSAWAVFDKVAAGGAPDIGFFRTAKVSIAGREVLALRHGMAGHRGVELSGPSEDGNAVRDAILEGGAEFGLVPLGTRAHFSAPLSNGWLGYPVPGIFTGEEFRGFRQWLGASGWEANTELGGSFYASNIEDYYVTPFDLGYQSIVKFDHDFVGREALEAITAEERRTKVTLVWNRDDVQRVFASQLGAGPVFKSLEFPVVSYAFNQFDEVRSPSTDELIGLSCYAGYLGSEGDVLSLALMGPGHAEIGSEVVLTWGEPKGGSRKPRVERHEQTQIRATVAPVPYSTSVRQQKRA
jgi:vanillate/3-O-methylgallate O-demethylase